VALKLAPLAAAVILALGCAAAGGEEAGPASAAEPAGPAPYPTAPGEQPTRWPAAGSPGQKPWCPPCYSLWPIPFTATFMLLLVPVMLGFFISGLLKRRHDWKPLVLGLFALGLGALAAAWELSDRFNKLASIREACGPYVYETVAQAAMYLVWGLIIALAGGLFTVILRWRNARGDDLDAEEAEEPEPETEG